MSSIQIRKYLLQDLNKDELNSYMLYIKGDENNTEWIEKVSLRRDVILLKNLTCKECGEYIHITERGICKCSLGHDCNKIILKHCNN